mmetsp:Transcript_19827/g.63088  ORF Transcript_19827/g.63088 Transcript_19827/m.63088 type:complete len:354 (-) Transcript_19827:565-1626(-)
MFAGRSTMAVINAAIRVWPADPSGNCVHRKLSAPLITSAIGSVKMASRRKSPQVSYSAVTAASRTPSAIAVRGCSTRQGAPAMGRPASQMPRPLPTAQAAASAQHDAAHSAINQILQVSPPRMRLQRISTRCARVRGSVTGVTKHLSTRCARAPLRNERRKIAMIFAPACANFLRWFSASTCRMRSVLASNQAWYWMWAAAESIGMRSTASGVRHCARRYLRAAERRVSSWSPSSPPAVRRCLSLSPPPNFEANAFMLESLWGVLSPPPPSLRAMRLSELPVVATLVGVGIVPDDSAEVVVSSAEGVAGSRREEERDAVSMAAAVGTTREVSEVRRERRFHLTSGRVMEVFSI